MIPSSVSDVLRSNSRIGVTRRRARAGLRNSRLAKMYYIAAALCCFVSTAKASTVLWTGLHDFHCGFPGNDCTITIGHLMVTVHWAGIPVGDVYHIYNDRGVDFIQQSIGVDHGSEVHDLGGHIMFDANPGVYEVFDMVAVFASGASTGHPLMASGGDRLTGVIHEGFFCDPQQAPCPTASVVEVNVDIYLGDATPPSYTKKCDSKQGGEQCTSCHGMARYSVHSLLVSLSVEDTPIGYAPPAGPPVHFTATYNERDAELPPSATYSNLGSKWSFNWLSYISDIPNPGPYPIPSVLLRAAGGGLEKYVFDSTTQSFLPDSQSQAVLVRIAPDTTHPDGSYERRLPDGSKQIYARSVQAPYSPRKFFMTAWVNPSGQTVTIQYLPGTTKIDKIFDAVGNQPTQFFYEDPSHPYRITKVTDPFNRSVIFGYLPGTGDGDGVDHGQLASIKDPVDILSQFHYLEGTDVIDSLSTPYGTTIFRRYESGTNRRIEIVDPEGGRERVEYRDNAPGIASTEAHPPDGFAGANTALDVANTFYWSKKAMQLYPVPLNNEPDYTKSKITHWLYNSDGTLSGIPSSEKAPLENRVWYSYQGQPDTTHVGLRAQPDQVVRILDDGSEQRKQFSYNTTGNLTKLVDPRNRVTTYEYDGNGIDLKKVYQRNPSGIFSDTESQAADLIAEYIYDPVNEPPHEPHIVKDASHRSTTYHYNHRGQIETITNAKNELTAYIYGPAPDVPNGYLASVSSPALGGFQRVITYTYDDHNRVQTVTDSPDNYTVAMAYDNLDRPSHKTYPDGTTEEFSYMDDKKGMTLDLTATKDRRGRWTTRHYNGNRQMDSTTDPSNRTTLYGWCNCGLLESITDPNNNPTVFEYDLQSRLTSKTYPDNSTITYMYENSTSRLKSMTDALNQTTNYTYYRDDQLYQVSYTNAINSTPTVTYQFDPHYNRIASMSDGIGTTSYAYNSVVSSASLGANQIYQIDGPLANDTITYSYDELGRALGQNISSTAAGVIYDSLGRISSSNNAIGTFTRTYETATSRLHELTFPNGQTATYDYFLNNFDRRLQTLQNHIGSTTLSRHDYAYDALGQIQTWNTTLGQNETASGFSYDDADQLTSQVRSTPDRSIVTDFEYDAAGNRLLKNTYNPHSGTSSGNVSIVCTANNLNQVDSISTQYGANPPSDPSPVTYDANGNMTYDGDLQTYEWDAANRLLAINYLDSGNRTEFAYDGLGHRVRIVEYGPAVTAVLQPKASGYAQYDTAPFNLTTGHYVLTFAGLNPNGGTNTCLLDAVMFNSTLIPSGGFEDPSVGGDKVAPPDSGWSYSGKAGIAAQGGKLMYGGPSAPPQGRQVAFITNNSSLWQSGTIAAGTYTLSFQAAQRPGGNDSYQQLGVKLRGTVNAKTFVWAGNTIAEERDDNGANVTKRFFAEGEQRIGGSDAGNYYYTRDHLGSIREVTDASGNLLAQYDYDAWGNSVVISGMSIDFGYTGHYFHQASRLNLAIYRAYSPTFGRWITRDPLEPVMINMFPSADHARMRLLNPEMLPEGPNIYRYSANNPVKLTDVSGLACGSGSTENIVPDYPFGFDFTEACEAHDNCYGTCGADKHQCDELLYNLAVRKCDSYRNLANPGYCHLLAGIYYRAVHMYGHGPFRAAQEPCCQQASPRGRKPLG
jgi:RHS repeat-associated protein